MREFRLVQYFKLLKFCVRSDEDKAEVCPGDRGIGHGA